MSDQKDVIFKENDTLLRCLNCDVYFLLESYHPKRLPLFCSDACKEESRLVRHARRLGKAVFPDKSSVLKSIEIWLGIVQKTKVGQRLKEGVKDFTSIVNPIMDRIQSSASSRVCDDEDQWALKHKRQVTKRTLLIEKYGLYNRVDLILSLKEKGLTDYMIATTLNKKGIPTVTGRGEWHSNTVDLFIKKHRAKKL